MSRVAIVQVPPVFQDRERTISKAIGLLDEAIAGGAELVIFPEAFIPGYPAWIWPLHPPGHLQPEGGQPAADPGGSRWPGLKGGDAPDNPR